MTVSSPQYMVAKPMNVVSQNNDADVFPSVAATEQPKDQRWAPRKHQNEKGHIFIPHKDIWVPCEVKNISATGALLDISGGGTVAGNSNLIPEQVTLVRKYFKEVTEVNCRVVRKGDGQIGVLFDGPILTRPYKPVRREARSLKSSIIR